MNNLEKEFTPYELALKLKQLGYPQNYYFAWYADGGLHYDSEYEESHFTHACCSAPTYSQAFRWFREKGIISEIHSDFDRMLGYNRGYIPVVQFIEFYNNGDCYETYEEAELACLRKLIEIVKNGK